MENSTHVTLGLNCMFAFIDNYNYLCSIYNFRLKLHFRQCQYIDSRRGRIGKVISFEYYMNGIFILLSLIFWLWLVIINIILHNSFVVSMNAIFDLRVRSSTMHSYKKVLTCIAILGYTSEFALWALREFWWICKKHTLGLVGFKE